MSGGHPRWIDIDSPSAVITAITAGKPLPRRPWWHHALDDILEGLEVGLLTAGPWILGGITGACTFWALTR